MRRPKPFRRALKIAVLLGALTLLAIGLGRRRRVVDTDPYGDETTSRISERQLTADSTFGGVERHEGKLYSTYDRTAARGGKQACPT